MLLAIEIGNTNVTLGIWDGRQWCQQWRLRTIHNRTIDEYAVALLTLLREAGLRDAVEKVIMASVVPVLTPVFARLSEQYLALTPVHVDASTDSGVDVQTDNPSEVGADRILNAAAAFHRVQGPCIIVDMGTATTFDVVTGAGALIGVVIAPGLRLAAEALTSYAAQLRRVPLQAPPQTIGRNTVHAVQSGTVLSYVGLVEGTIQRILTEHPDRDERVHVIGTGGLITLVTPHTQIIDEVDPWLTLTGLRVIAERVTGA